MIPSVEINLALKLTESAKGLPRALMLSFLDQAEKHLAEAAKNLSDPQDRLNHKHVGELVASLRGQPAQLGAYSRLGADKPHPLQPILLLGILGFLIWKFALKK